MDLSWLSGWAEAHPTIVGLVLVPLVTGVFNFLCKPKTEEQYAKIAAFSPRLAAILQMVGALGLDGNKAAKIFLEKVVKTPPKPPPQGPTRVPSSDPPPPPPEPPTKPDLAARSRGPLLRLTIATLTMVLLLVGTAGCSLLTGQVLTPREQARAAVVLVAEGVRFADDGCSAYVRLSGDLDTGKVCTEAYKVARGSLLSIAGAIDAWDAGATRGNVSCAVVQAAGALRTVKATLAVVHVSLPPIVDDAIAIAPILGGCPDAAQ